MIRSMTGFAAAGREDAGYTVNVTMKAVNHRFLDVALKVPSSLAPLEPSLRAAVQERLARGRVEVAIAVESAVPPERQVVIDETLLERVAQALAAARDRGLITGGLTAADALRLPQVLEIRSAARASDPAEVPGPLAALTERVTGEALAALVVMRETEGRFLQADLDGRITAIAAHVDELERQAREGQAALESRLRERLAGLPADLQGDPASVAQEVVRFVARSDVDEEVVRLRSHVEHWRALAAGADPCGRKLDFLVQEMNRELNTIGAKVEGARASEVVIEAKAELERIREQVQNVE